MTRRLFVALSLLALACQGRAPSSSGAAVPTVASRDDPSDCVDGPPPDTQAGEARKRFEDALGELAGCTRDLASRGQIQVSLTFGASGTASKVEIRRAAIDDCEAVECVRAGLARMTVPAANEGVTRRLVADVLLLPGSAPRRLEGSSWEKGAEKGRCADAHETPVASAGEESAKGESSASGRLPPETIYRIIRGQRDAIRACYDDGRRRDPHLRGKVTVRFVIARDGSVSRAEVVGNEVPDCRVASCVRNEISKCAFPRPEGGNVTIVYPIQFESP